MDDKKIPLCLFWYQNEIPDSVDECLQTWTVDHRFNTTVYNGETAAAFFENTGMNREKLAFDTCVPFAMAADYFRLFILQARGGIYIDANWAQISDILPLFESSSSPEQNGVVISVTENANRWGDAFTDVLLANNMDILLNGILHFASPDDIYVKIACEISTLNIESKATESIAFAAGSGVLTLLLALRNFKSRDAYLVFMADLSQHEFFGHSLTTVIQNTIAATEPYDFETLKTEFLKINVVSGLALNTYISRNGLGQYHKDHWLQHKGSLYRSNPVPDHG